MRLQTHYAKKIVLNAATFSLFLHIRCGYLRFADMASTRVPVGINRFLQIPNGRALGQAQEGIFAAFPAGLARSLESNSRHISLKAGEVLFFEGDAANRLYWVIDGVLKSSARSPDGEERILGLLGPGAIIGELGMLDHGPCSATVQAIRPSELCFVSRERVRSLFLTDQVLLKQLLDTLVCRLRRADEEIAASLQPIGIRVARALYELMDLLGEKEDPAGTVVVTRHLRQTDIAALAGVSRESVTRIIVALKKRGVLKQLSRFSFSIDRVRLEIEARPASSRHSAHQGSPRRQVTSSASA